MIAQQLGLPFEGQADVAGSMNIVFEADLSHLVAHRPSVLYWVLQPGSNIGGIGLGLVRMVRPWNEWLIVWGYDINEPPPEVDEAQARQIAHNLIGDDTVPVRITSTSLWTNNKLYATRYSEGRVFCMGDAVHRHPPSNGLGSNTSVQDSYNLAWKLALVLEGKADPALLRTYDDERAPVGKQIVLRANKSIEEFGPIFEALGLLETNDPGQMIRNVGARRDDTPEAAVQREKLRVAIELKNYEFNAHGVELGQRYRSAAVVPDGTPEPGLRRGPGAVLPRDDVAGRTAAALLARPGRAPREHARPRGQGTLRAPDRDQRLGVGACGACGVGSDRRRDRVLRHRARPRGDRSLRRLGACPRGRGERLRARPPRRPRRVAVRDGRRRLRRGTAARNGPDPPPELGRLSPSRVH